MKNKYKYGFLGIILIVSLGLYAFQDSVYFKINKAFDIFGALYREIAANYVTEVDVDELMKSGIQGMLQSLDPYTVFYEEAETETIDMLTTGSYVGVGISVNILDSMLTVVDVNEGYSVQKSGLRVGDRIYKIDSTFVLRSTSEDLRDFTKGIPGTQLKMWVIRDGTSDTLLFTLKREQIQLKNISYYGIIDSVAYIKLEGFTKSSADELRTALYTLKNRYKFSGIMLDLRDNPGGLLESAVSVCEMFVPKSSTIVTTKGRNNEYSYKSMVEPIVPTTPLVVLINQRSASASEVVAGAIQDLDRGVIVGRLSYGKALVQSIFALPYQTNLKITTAKYFTPSGRCIQRLNLINKRFSKDKNGDNIIDTNVFYTSGGRKVLEYKGIMPDTTVDEEHIPEQIKSLAENNYFFDFANIYCSNLNSLPENFKADTKLVDNFIKYVEKHGKSNKSYMDVRLESLAKAAKEEGFSEYFSKQLGSLGKKITDEEKIILKKNSDLVERILNMEILRRLGTDESFFKENLAHDKDVLTAIDIIKTSRYKKILATTGLVNPTKNN